MTQIPTLTQLLQQAVETRLIDVHTALIAKVESYDAAKQQVSVSPLLKRTIKTLDNEIVREQLPILSEVPVLFPRAGGFFISFPIQPGDFVQLVFNESSIDEWNTDTASDEVYADRFSLQGAVAIPGVYPESRPLSGAHRANFVAGKDNGVQLHIDGEKIRLGSAEANEALAIASRVEAELNKIIMAFNAHVHASNGVATQSSITPTSDIANSESGRRTMGDEPHPSRLYSILFGEPKILDVLSLKLGRVDSQEPVSFDIKPHELASFAIDQIFFEEEVT